MRQTKMQINGELCKKIEIWDFKVQVQNPETIELEILEVKSELNA